MLFRSDKAAVTLGVQLVVSFVDLDDRVWVDGSQAGHGFLAWPFPCVAVISAGNAPARRARVLETTVSGTSGTIRRSRSIAQSRKRGAIWLELVNGSRRR